MPLRVAFVGFQHAHAFSLYSDLQEHPNVEVVAACEEDPAARVKASEHGIAVTHTSYAGMLKDVSCDAVACCNWYGIRGARLIAAMRAGKHVIADKPLCTRLNELDEIERLAASKHLKVGCQLPVQYHPPFVTAHKLIRDGAIGDVHTVTFNAAHTLNYAIRPAWMFEPSKYGGSINDIAIHGIDAVPWLTGRSFTGITAAREWNARLSEHPKFGDAAVVLLKLDNGGAVFGDVSWLSPDEAGYKTPFYWRFTILGSAGAVETSWHAESVRVFKQGTNDIVDAPLITADAGSYVGDWLLDINNTPASDRLHTERILRSSRTTLLAQHAATMKTRDVSLP